MPSSGRISSARPARATWPGMPQTVLVASSCAMTAAPVAASASRRRAVGAHAGQHHRERRGSEDRGGVAEQDVDGRPAEIHRRPVVDAEHDLVELVADKPMWRPPGAT